MSEISKVVAYCVKCKAKQEMQSPTPVFTVKGQAATRGICGECGTRMFRMGRTPQHEGMTPPPKPEPKKPTGKLVIVESPTKARTVGRFLGKGYTVKASVGHVRDLLRSQISVDVANDFTPKYRIPNEKRKVVKELTAVVKKCSEVYLATDPDREGEAIAWHLREVLGLQSEQVKRVVFHEITSSAVEAAFSHPREINMDLVDAQQARRILDRLVGYNLSPLLWRKVRSRLSAGRVQSVALRLVVEREREIGRFDPEEYWTLAALLKPQKGEGRKKPREFKARLVRVDNKEVELKNEEDVRLLVDALENAEYEVSKVKPGKRTRKPSAPYTTSTMQQEATRKLGFTARKAMSVAQELYEGIDPGEGQQVGLITYMRTDSTNVSQQSQDEVRTFVTDRYGVEFLPEKPPIYKTKAKAAQEAHEAIRPTSVLRTPEGIKAYLSRDQFRLYDLIWRRFVASQMSAAQYETLSVEISAGTAQNKPYVFRVSGSILRFPGFLVVYEETKSENGKKEKNQALPPLALNDILDLVRLLPEQHFTQPPPKYTDASLIRALEEYGIGRPSTYAAILSTIQQRGYVAREKRRYTPTETGVLVNDLLVKHFAGLINVDFTAQMEAQLDDVAAGKREWVTLMHDFYVPFAETLSKADAAIPKIEQIEYVGRECPKCEDGQLIIRWGRYGKFVGCNNFPQCRYTEPWLEKIGVACPECDTGEIAMKRTKKGRTFYGCSNWPECEFTSWQRPLAQRCPACRGVLTIVRRDVAKCQSCDATYAVDELELAQPTSPVPVK